MEHFLTEQKNSVDDFSFSFFGSVSKSEVKLSKKREVLGIIWVILRCRQEFTTPSVAIGLSNCLPRSLGLCCGLFGVGRETVLENESGQQRRFSRSLVGLPAPPSALLPPNTRQLSSASGEGRDGEGGGKSREGEGAKRRAECDM